MRPVTPDNLTTRRFHFGGRRIRFALVAGRGAAWEAWIGSLHIRLFYRLGGVVNWQARVDFHWSTESPDTSEVPLPVLRIAMTRGRGDARSAVAEAERLAVDAFAAMGDALGYEVER